MRYLIACLLFISLFSCKKKTNEWAAAKTIIDMAYGLDPQQKLDLYLPENRSTDYTSLIVFIHGGGWTEGDKKDFTPSVAELQKRFPATAIANLNYRLYKNGTNLFPTQENDVLAAMKALSDQSAVLGFNAGSVAYIGASAGGHLALLQAYKNTYPDKAKAVVSFFGPTELASLYNNPPNPLIPPLLASLTGTTPGNNVFPYRINSPVEYVNNFSSPTLLFHGGLDIVVSPSQSEVLKQKCNSSGVPVEYYFYPTEGHGWTGANLDDSYNKLEAFLKKYGL